MNKEEFKSLLKEILEKSIWVSVNFTDISYGTLKIDFKDISNYKHSMNIESIEKGGNIKVTNIYYTNLKRMLDFLVGIIQEYSNPKLHTTKESLFAIERVTWTINKIKEESSMLVNLYTAFSFSKPNDLKYIGDMLIEYKNKIDPVITKTEDLINELNERILKENGN